MLRPTLNLTNECANFGDRIHELRVRPISWLLLIVVETSPKRLYSGVSLGDTNFETIKRQGTRKREFIHPHSLLLNTKLSYRPARYEVLRHRSLRCLRRRSLGQRSPCKLNAWA